MAKNRKNKSKKIAVVKIKKSSIKEKIEQPDVITPLDEPNSYPNLFPLTMALLMPPNDDDVFADNVLFPDFVVGKTEPPILKKAGSIRELDSIEQQANKTVDEINEVQKKIKILMQRTDLNDSEELELDIQNVQLMKLLEDFEKSLAKIIAIFRGEPANRLDGYGILVTPHIGWPRDCESVESHHDIKNVAKWYEVTDLTYLLSPNASFNKGANLSMSSDLLKIFDELQKKTKSVPNKDAKRNQKFQRLKKKFNILLPPPKSDVNKQNLQWMDEKLHRDHLEMLNATKNLKIFQCWDQLELKYNIVDALIISLKDAIKSTSPFFYANTAVKSKFLADQSILVQALDDFKRETCRMFAEAGLADYWKLHPESIRLGSQPCFDVTIRRRLSEVDQVVPLDEPRLSFLQFSPFNAKYNSEIMNVAKWYEVTDLTYLLSPNASFNKGANLSMSSDLLKIFDELQKKTKSVPNKDAKRNQKFQRLKKKFNILLPPPKSDVNKQNLQWMDEKLHRDHLEMLNAMKTLKIFQCWDQLELKYNIVNALIISLKDAIKSTSPFFYANTAVKSKFLADQSILVQALDYFKRETCRTFAEAGLADYWKLNPESIRLGSQPCFDVTIRRRLSEVDQVVPLNEPKTEVVVLTVQPVQREIQP